MFYAEKVLVGLTLDQWFSLGVPLQAQGLPPNNLTSLSFICLLVNSSYGCCQIFLQQVKGGVKF
jgi:hypothetical protein